MGLSLKKYQTYQLAMRQWVHVERVVYSWIFYSWCLSGYDLLEEFDTGDANAFVRCRVPNL